MAVYSKDYTEVLTCFSSFNIKLIFSIHFRHITRQTYSKTISCRLQTILRFLLLKCDNLQRFTIVNSVYFGFGQLVRQNNQFQFVISALQLCYFSLAVGLTSFE